MASNTHSLWSALIVNGFDQNLSANESSPAILEHWCCHSILDLFKLPGRRILQALEVEGINTHFISYSLMWILYSRVNFNYRCHWSCSFYQYEFLPTTKHKIMLAFSKVREKWTALVAHLFCIVSLSDLKYPGLFRVSHFKRWFL